MLVLVFEFKLGIPFWVHLALFLVVSTLGDPLSLVLDLKLLGIPLLKDAGSGVMDFASL